MKHSTQRILTTHTGSLARPKDLLDLMKAKESGQPYDHEAYATHVRGAVAEVVHKQTENGIDVVSDGEQSKTGFSNYIRERLGGFEPDKTAQGPSARSRGREREAFLEYYAMLSTQPYATTRVTSQRPMVCVSPVSYKGLAAVQTDIENLKSALKGVKVEETFMPATSSRGPGRNEYYRTEDEYRHAIADAIREEYKAILDAGFILQVDDPGLTSLYQSDESLSIEERRKNAEKYVELLNYSLRDIAADKVRFHTCYGVNEGPRIHDIALKDIVGLMLKIKAGAYSFEAANPRHQHEWHVFENVKVPDGRILIPGMTSHAYNIVEHPEHIAELVVNYAKLVGRENLMIGNDCGFSSQAVYQPEIHPSVGWAKFQAMAEGAKLASQKLWGR